MKKILFILHLPPPVHGASMASKYIHDSKSINETFATGYINLMTNDTIANSGKGSPKKLLGVVKILWKLLKALVNNKYDLCYVSLNAKGVAFYKDFLTVVMLKIFRRKIIYHFHNKGVAAASKGLVNRFLYRVTFKNAKCILLTPNIYDDIRMYVNSNNVYYCANGIPAPSQNTSTLKNTNDDPCRLLFLSNMMEEKGVYVLLDACRLLKEKYALTFECHFIGDWSDVTKEQFEEKVMQYSLGNHVYAHGKKYNEEKFYFFENSDIFVFPTYYHNEVLPLVILEAMQFRLPVVSTIIGGVSDEVIDGKTGYLVPQKDTEDTAAKLSILISDPVLRKQMGQNGYDHFMKNFTLENYENNLIRIFDEVA